VATVTLLTAERQTNGPLDKSPAAEKNMQTFADTAVMIN